MSSCVDFGVFTGETGPTTTMYLETTHWLYFKTQKFTHHDIYNRFRLDEEDPYIKKILYVLFSISYAMFVEAALNN